MIYFLSQNYAKCICNNDLLVLKNILKVHVHVFYKKKVYKKMRLKLSKSYEAQFSILSIFMSHKSIVHHYCIQNAKDGIQIQVYSINNECITHFSQFISEKVKKNLRKSQVQFWEKLRKLRLIQNYVFLIKKTCFLSNHHSTNPVSSQLQNFEIFPRHH